MPQSSTTDLAHGTLNGADELSVQLIEPDGMPDVVRITWPPQPAVVQPAPRFREVAATLTRLFAEAATTLAALKARRRL